MQEKKITCSEPGYNQEFVIAYDKLAIATGSQVSPSVGASAGRFNLLQRVPCWACQAYLVVFKVHLARCSAACLRALTASAYVHSQRQYILGLQYGTDAGCLYGAGLCTSVCC